MLKNRAFLHLSSFSSESARGLRVLGSCTTSVQASPLHSAIQKEGRKDCLKLQREHGRKDKEVSQTVGPSFLSWLVSCTHSLCVSWGGTLGSCVKELASHWLAEVKCGQLGSASMRCSQIPRRLQPNSAVMKSSTLLC